MGANLCYGQVVSIEAASDAAPGVSIWLDNVICQQDIGASQHVRFSLKSGSVGQIWQSGLAVATAAYIAHANGQDGGVTVVFPWRDGGYAKNRDVPVVTRINAPCASDPEGHSGPGGHCKP